MFEFRRALFSVTTRGLKEFCLPSLFSRMTFIIREAAITFLANRVIHNISGLEIYIYLFAFNDIVNSSAFLRQMVG
jgi:hypothetical protein